MPRAFQQIFECIQATDVSYYVVRTSYLEIYNEEIRDLLQKQNNHKLEVKEHPEKGMNQNCFYKYLTGVWTLCNTFFASSILIFHNRHLATIHSPMIYTYLATIQSPTTHIFSSTPFLLFFNQKWDSYMLTPHCSRMERSVCKK